MHAWSSAFGNWCGGAAIGLAAVCLAGAPVLAQEAPELDAGAFQACLSRLAASSGFSRIRASTFAEHTRGLAPDPSVIRALNHQPEFSIPVWDYMAMLVDAERVADGRAAHQRWHEVLQRIEQQYGVPTPVVVAVWGVESNYGRNLGQRPLVQSLATLSCFGRRQDYFRGEFAAALRILQEGHVAPEQLTGSWAGAFGQTQFMPSTFFESAVDFDGDGRRNIVSSVPDALASTARFLQNAGWRSGQPWGLEVLAPEGARRNASRKNRQSLAHWRDAGVRPARGSALPASLPDAGLLVPARGGPAFLVGRNFNALYRYNASENYALAIAHLSDLIANPALEPRFATSWPTDDPGLSRAENRQLQVLLLMRGHDIGAVDGIIGKATRSAIAEEQQRLGMNADGRAGQKLLRTLRTD